MSATPDRTPAVLRVVGALWIFGVVFRLAVTWADIHEREHALEVASPVASRIPFPIPRSGRAENRRGDRVIFAAPSGILYALDPPNRRPYWAIRLGDRFIGAPELHGETLRVGVEVNGERVLATVDARTGTVTPRR